MKTLLSVIALLIACSSLNAQDLASFKNLVGSTWVSEGKQLGGFDGKTEKVFEWGLDGKIVKVKTWTTDPQSGEFGLRNEGVRAWDQAAGKVLFYEFDKFGGITKGEVIMEESSLHYQYEYEGLTLRDSWQKVDENTYDYTVGQWENGDWSQVFHKAQFIRQK